MFWYTGHWYTVNNEIQHLNNLGLEHSRLQDIDINNFPEHVHWKPAKDARDFLPSIFDGRNPINPQWCTVKYYDKLYPGSLVSWTSSPNHQQQLFVGIEWKMMDSICLLKPLLFLPQSRFSWKMECLQDEFPWNSGNFWQMFHVHDYPHIPSQDTLSGWFSFSPLGYVGSLDGTQYTPEN